MNRHIALALMGLTCQLGGGVGCTEVVDPPDPETDAGEGSAPSDEHSPDGGALDGDAGSVDEVDVPVDGGATSEPSGLLAAYVDCDWNSWGVYEATAWDSYVTVVGHAADGSAVEMYLWDALDPGVYELGPDSSSQLIWRSFLGGEEQGAYGTDHGEAQVEVLTLDRERIVGRFNGVLGYVDAFPGTSNAVELSGGYFDVTFADGQGPSGISPDAGPGGECEGLSFLGDGGAVD